MSPPKLTNRQVRTARRAVAVGRTLTSVADRLGVSRPTLADAVYGVTYKSVADPGPLARPNPQPRRVKKCRVDTCRGDAREEDLCPKHLYRQRRYGDPLGGRYEQRGTKPWRRPKLAPDDRRHGSTTGYTYYHCRCPRCRAAYAAAARRRRKEN